MWAIPKDGFVLMGGLFAPDPTPKKEFEIAKGVLLASLSIPSRPVVEREAGQIVKVERLRDIFLGRRRLPLVGESAGLMGASTGERMSFALISGRLCAEAMNKTRDGAALKRYRILAREGLFRIWRERTKPVVGILGPPCNKQVGPTILAESKEWKTVSLH